ncbi:chitobiase/beta-hexosaminidase C-terminal domain-containing protein [Flavobacterium taihuense]|uniref:Chitobiase/beta-hexosaminidase C-terminal domain-containing protein n=1 Tax=Flavobacterium taihuense TaxID=2857508 RepID=A0ABS6XWI8_9FLAO|nr:chitobiase/beta-hexosaminidase C-terminal domain-containing protein [Flavobacterium taihuense]MBW4361040.1 chitobiase/beta-hexosaminidase C-terminal domain-containing protein [Flavobacterium taihuense]
MKPELTHNCKNNKPNRANKKKGFYSDPIICFKFFLLIVFHIVSATVVAQINPPNPFKAPLYWSVYEYCYTNNSSIPEDVWSQNIDWVEANLKPYGYNMICIDGWGDIAANITYDQNGYLTSHSDKWSHDFAWWSANLQSRGMTLGMYQNPLWVSRTAADAGAKIKGTNIPLSNIINTSENATWFTWVQVNNTGAEEYVKGYVQHFADMGIKFLRVDFLSWYESGYDRNMGIVGPARPKADYEKALRWMREACDANGMLLSLVMPNLNNEAELEQKYGHMIRINDDCATGEWERFNNFDRGVRRTEWSQWGNTMDGLAYWSYIAGRDKITLDGDFIRLNTFANDEEKKTAISANLLAGGPVTPADQYNTIGTNLWLYQNTEMLALNQDKFVGKPVSSDPTNVNSQVWKGQMSNGDWIVGLFNRENTVQTRSINFATDLGLTASSDARDLWEHTDLGTITAYSVSIPAHGCKIIRISPTVSNKVVSPVLSPVGGTYTSAQSVTLSTTTAGAVIRYTTDGSTPNTSSAVYSGAISVTESKTIKAYATKSGMVDSNISQAIYRINPPPPSPWLHGDIGSVNVGGTAGYSGGSFNNTGAGADIEGTTDAFHYIYQPVSGDVTITARVESLTNTDPWAKAGVMIRSTTAANAINTLTAVTPKNGAMFQKRTTNGGSTSSTTAANVSSPVWVRLQKIGNTISSFRSIDGLIWTQIGVAVTVTLPSTFYVGLAVTSHNIGTLATATYSDVSINTGGTVATPTFSPVAGTYTSPQSVTLSTTTAGAVIRYTTNGSTPTNISPIYTSPINVSASSTIKAYASKSGMTNSNIAQAVYTISPPLPAPWLHSDIGTVNLAGNALYSSGSFSNIGAGADIQGTSDAFHYIYQSISGDVTVTARVESLNNTDPWAKAGVMIRSTLNANSKNVFTAITPSNGITFQSRASTGGSTTATGATGFSSPYWVRIKRLGNIVSSFRSLDGITWTQVGTNLTTSLGTQVYIGLAVSSHTTATLATAVFKNVTVTTSGGTVTYKQAMNPSKLAIEEEDEGLVSIYPNPAKELVNIDLRKFKDTSVEIQLANLTGQILKEEKVMGGGMHEMNTSTLKTGVYLITLRGNDLILVKRLLIE